jgi:hypothetical protein
MRHILPTTADILGTLPPGEQDELISLVALAGAAERGVGWIAVPGEAWAAFTAKVRRGDYDQT